MNSYRKDIRELMVAVNVIDGIYDMAAKKVGIKINALEKLVMLLAGKHRFLVFCKYAHF